MLLCRWCGSVAVVGRRGRVSGGPPGGTKAPRDPGSGRELPRKSNQRQHGGAGRRRSLASHPRPWRDLSRDGLSLDELSHDMRRDLSRDGLSLDELSRDMRRDLSPEGLSIDDVSPLSHRIKF